MSSSSSGYDDDANIELGASATLLLSTNKYTKIWRKSLYIGFLISLKKPTTASYESLSPQSPLSSVPYTSLPPSRTSSFVAIEIHPDAEEKEKEVEECIRNDIARIVKEQDLPSLFHLGGVDRICPVLLSQRQHSEVGTIDDENLRMLEIAKPLQGTKFYSFFLDSCKCNWFTLLMLLISAGLSFAIDFKQEGPKYGWHDGVALLLAVFLLVAFSSAAKFMRERKKLILAKRKDKLEFTVKRGEEFFVVPISDIVVGEMVLLRPGDEVPADGLLVSDETIVLAEGRKSKSDPFLISGSRVIEGQGWMLTTSIENRTNLSERRGLLESLIEKPISYIDKCALSISVLVALVVFIRLICKQDGNSSGLPEIKGKVSVSLLVEILSGAFLRPQGRISILTSLVTVTILCVQHGMPLVITMSLKFQSDKLEAVQGVVVNDLSACTTMGLVTVICIDVSGGLISKPVEVSRIWMGEKDISKVKVSETDEPVLDVLKQGVGFSVLVPELSLCPMSNSLVSWAETTWEMNMQSFTENFNILKRSEPNSNQDLRVLVKKVEGNEQVMHLHWSGDASTILEKCSLYYDCRGGRHAMENQKAKFGQMIKEMEDNGLKPIAFAHRETDVEELDQDELILLGLIGLKYTCQESTRLALENLINTGIQIELVSEDDIMTVKDIARELGMEDGVLLEGKELQDLNVKARLEKVDLALVMGSFNPEDKLQMVKYLQEKGHVVAFIGRRLMTTHTSVLEVADVGIDYDPLSSIVNRDSSGISIKCFSALKPIFQAGRSKYHNIQKFIQLQLTFTISWLLITLITTICTGDSPLTAPQFIFVNVQMCFLGGLMMVMELSSKEKLVKNRNQPIITKEIWKSIVIQVLYQASVCMILEFGGRVSNREKEVRKTMIFNAFLLCQIFNQLNTMHLLKREVFKIVLQSYLFMVALSGCFLVQVLVIEYAKGLANCMRLNIVQWAICVVVGTTPWICELTLKTLPVILGSNSASESNTSPSEPPPPFYLSPGFPFLMLLLFPLGLICGQKGMTFRQWIVTDELT